MNIYAEICLQVIWPLIVLLLALFVLRQIRDDVRPIIVNVISGVAKDAQTNAQAYALCILFGLSASASAFIDVFQHLAAADLRALSWHQYATLWVKIANPFIVAVLAYATKSKFVEAEAKVDKAEKEAKGNTTPPIPIR